MYSIFRSYMLKLKYLILSIAFVFISMGPTIYIHFCKGSITNFTIFKDNLLKDCCYTDCCHTKENVKNTELVIENHCCENEVICVSNFIQEFLVQNSYILKHFTNYFNEIIFVKIKFEEVELYLKQCHHYPPPPIKFSYWKYSVRKFSDEIPMV